MGLTNSIQNEILEILRTKSKKYPIAINELVDELSYSNGLIHRHIKILETKGLVESKRVVKVKGGTTFYKTPNSKWPKHLGRKCFDCQNKSKIATCTFHEEVAERGMIIRSERVGVKLTKNTVACEEYIKMKTHWYKQKYEDFLDENRRITASETGFKISYHCANEKCQAELPSLGDGFITKLGSSVVRCDACDSFYKTLFDKKKKTFKVNYNIERGIEYKENFAKVTGGEEPESLYSSDNHGIVIHSLQDSDINFRTRTLTTYNWIGAVSYTHLTLPTILLV